MYRPYFQTSAGYVVAVVVLFACSSREASEVDDAVHATTTVEIAGHTDAPPIRRAFLGGYFETKNTSFPAELDQAIAGKPTARPVVVWAGLEVRHSFEK
ncbi:MAG: hypothetical protein JWM74_687 [Myxococcaceae bacterium]|nr:hypothetical protein [Myxococcaceae bacterium]